ncbi:MAG: hypothetical protein U9Q81_26575 [Pseudomonadota bacterium]|nr:hypothetical protein [Pseudomonadota bacterium]
MTASYDSIEDAFSALADPSDPAWSDAFRFLAAHPDTAQMMLEVFRETLMQMGVEPTGVDQASGEPAYSLSDVARAMGVPEDELDVSVRQSGSDT